MLKAKNMLLQSVMLSQADTWWHVAADKCMGWLEPYPNEAV